MSSEAATLAHRARFGMWVFLASEVLFFGGIFMAYAVGRMLHPAGFAVASRHTDVVLGTLNTALLLTSSALVAAASEWAEAARWRPCRWALGLAALLGLAFLMVKGMEYRHEWHEGLLPGPAFQIDDGPGPAGAELFFQMYFVATALHALHLTIGVAVLAWLAIRSRQSADEALSRSVEVGALYWHFVDIVWILLYPLLYLVGRHAS